MYPEITAKLSHRIRLTSALALLIAVMLSSNLKAQDSHYAVFSFVQRPVNARIAGLGGVNVSLADRDQSSFVSNPVLTGDTLAGFASVGYQFFSGGIGQAGFSWSPVVGKFGMISFGVQHIGYGSITSYDASGNELGVFNARETALYVSKQRMLGNYRFGASLKAISSAFAGFRAGALAVDLGGLFVHPEKDFTVGMVIKNVGFVVRDYTGNSDSSLPFDVQIGTTFKPEFMPVRFSITASRLADFNEVTYVNNQPTEPRVLDKVFRHFNFGAEVLVHRNVNVLVGYNYGLHQELKLDNAGGGAGVALGIATQISAVNFVFSRLTYVAGSPAYNFTLSANLNRMIYKK
ncbi:MAG TPA: type IX secretion system protein PorQ [Ohtaekwangia sp.]|nr:type IX secretion system protein PorQ [Ohtaekwangia sp.]